MYKKVEKESKTAIEIEKDTKSTGLTNDQSLTAIKKYWYKLNPDLKEMENSDGYTIYFEVESSNEEQIVVLFRSYTGALTRYYIDRSTGDTYVTGYMPGITEKEEKTGEEFNIKQYLD